MKGVFAKICAVLALLAIISIGTIGCGETFSGVGKDARRIGKGVKTIFVRDTME